MDESESAPAAPAAALSGAVPSARYLVPRIFVAGVLPAVTYAILRPHVSADWIGLALVMVFPLTLVVGERLQRGSFDPVGIIAMMGIGVGLLGAVAFHGNATLLKMRESALTGVFGIVCLVSLGAPRPMMFYLGRAFATAGDTSRIPEYDATWDAPGAARRYRTVTAVWGFGLAAEAALRITLAVSLSTQRFLAVSPVVSFSTLAGLLWYTTRSVRAGEAAALAALNLTD